MISVILPVYKEPHLNKTIQSLLDGAKGEIEILPVFDGDLPQEEVLPDKRIRPIFLANHEGMRTATNNGILRSLGDWIMKCDAHCVFADGWDKDLLENTRVNWLMVPRRYSVKEETWTRNDDRPKVDYHFLSFPLDETRSIPRYGTSFQVINTTWRKKPEIDDIMTFQGSCWFAHKGFFMEYIYPLDDLHYGPFAQEQQEMGLKYWLVADGAVKVNKKTWYAHLSKRKRHYHSGQFSEETKTAEELKGYNEWLTRHWMNNEESNMKHDFKWLVDKFQPLPGWENWEERWKQHLSAN